MQKAVRIGDRPTESGLGRKRAERLSARPGKSNAANPGVFVTGFTAALYALRSPCALERTLSPRIQPIRGGRNVAQSPG